MDGAKVLRMSIASALVPLALLVLGSCASLIAIAPQTPPAPQSFPPQLVAKGAQLSAIGNCVTCHTAREGKPYAGGFPIKTPFGTVHGTNITPEPETGIGLWSEAAFARAMREGVDREGRHLYPAFPYDHFTKTTEEDIRALYAFIMTREPVRARVPVNTVIIPRPLIAIWKAMYFERGVFRANPARDARWNRGAYLSEGLGHCGACHTPRNKLGAEDKRRPYAGGEVAGWHAPALDAGSPSPVPWTAQAMAAYLRSGIAEAHALAAGPMIGVVRNLAQVDEADIGAIALYFESLDTRAAAVREGEARKALAAGPRGRALAAGAGAGAMIYAGACADCHDRGRAAEGGALRLPLAIGLTLPTPANLIHIVRDGIVPKEHERQPWMPDYAGALTEQQLTELVIYLRTFTDLPPWPDVAAEVRKAAKGDE